jgi:hypothetical protein
VNYLWSRLCEPQQEDGVGWYRCAITGEHFPGALLNKAETVGFRTTCFVEAHSVDDAEVKAFQMLRADARLKLPDGVSYPLETKVHLNEIEPVPRDVVPEEKPEFIFFDECQ